jgi:hypothetical protein
MSVKSLSIVAAAALALCAGAAQAVDVPVQLTVNGNFETGTFSSWEQFPSAAGQQTIVSPGAGGSTFAAMIMNDVPRSNSLIKQANLNLPGGLIAGETVWIAFDAKGSFPDGGVAFAEFFSEKAGGGTNKAEILGGGPLAVNPNTWTTFNFTTTVASAGAGGAPGGVTLQLGATTGGAAGTTMYYDNASVMVMRPVPEPGTYALMLAGLAGLGLLAKRRRQA